MQTKLAHVSLTDITVSETNKMFREANELTDEALKDLIDSIKVNGVISPVMLTPRSDGPTKYMLVCGERRYRAATFAGLASIPCNIRELTDDQVLDLQLIENLERKDVHPAKEARAYKMLMEKHPELTIHDLALKFAKSEHYISIRLKLNDLIPEAMADFSQDLMSIGHAILIARLMPGDQKKVIQHCTQQYRDGKKSLKFYDTIQALQEYIDDAVICNLSAAAFKKDDATLLPKAGPCTTCPKRSGANQLFADVKQDDRCFDPTCFLAKRIKFLATQIPDILEKQPDTVFMTDWRREKVDPEIARVLEEHKVPVLTPNDYGTYNYGNQAKMKGIYVSGEQIGTVATVYSTKVKAKSLDAKSQDKISASVAIARIKERTKRAAELDQEKIYTNTIGQLQASKDFLSSRTTKPTKAERGLIAQFLYNHADYSLKDDLQKALKLNIRSEKAEAEAFKSITDADLAMMVRRIAVKQYNSPYHHDSTEGLLITEMARDWKIPVDDLIKAQGEIRKKREARAKERIADLQPKQKAKKS